MVYLQDVQFLSDIVGILGLWVGISVLSMVEVIQLDFKLLLFWYKKCRAKKENYRPVSPSTNTSGPRSDRSSAFGFEHLHQRQYGYPHVAPVYV